MGRMPVTARCSRRRIAGAAAAAPSGRADAIGAVRRTCSQSAGFPLRGVTGADGTLSSKTGSGLVRAARSLRANLSFGVVPPSPPGDGSRCPMQPPKRAHHRSSGPAGPELQTRKAYPRR